MTGTASRGPYELGRVTADLVVLTVLSEEYEAVLGCLAAPDLLLGSEGAPNTYAWQLGVIDAPRYGASFRVVVGWARRRRRTARWRRCKRSSCSIRGTSRSAAWRVGSIEVRARGASLRLPAQLRERDPRVPAGCRSGVCAPVGERPSKASCGVARRRAAERRAGRDRQPARCGSWQWEEVARPKRKFQYI